VGRGRKVTFPHGPAFASFRGVFVKGNGRYIGPYGRGRVLSHDGQVQDEEVDTLVGANASFPTRNEETMFTIPILVETLH
jgi:hypothetical protein